ncbi:MAG TPA: hypothetical protein DHV48_11870 [Prolixibacteraceae bacterium]|nr:hypothetical protein [Prolixibacteraceae bacterium]
MSFPTTYHANGKLLLTGEYLVLHGAKALALPLKLGQQLTVQEGLDSANIIWQAFYDGKIWFSCELNPNDFSTIKTSHPEKSAILRKIFRNIKTLNPDFHLKPGTKIETSLDANPEWGFGSSSTLVSLLSQWTKVDPFALNELVFKGSGFDIACANADGPIFYVRNKPVVPARLTYPFTNQLFLVYSGQKKGTASEVSNFLKMKTMPDGLVEEISMLSLEFANCRNHATFNHLIVQHEDIVGKLLGKLPVKIEYYPDFEGEIKSLGAWGGDFYLISTKLPFSGVRKYFENKGLTTIFRWNDLILKRENR